MLYRDVKDGGLGLFHVRIRALALLIRSFLETALNPNYCHSLFHEFLFRFNVMGEVRLPNPGATPYYSNAFSTTICHYTQNYPLNISVMTTKQWYKVLMGESKVHTQSEV